VQAISYDRKIRAVQVGCGSMGSVWQNILETMPDIEIVGLVDVIEEAARKEAEKHHLSCVISTDLASVLEQTWPDVVFDCAIPSAHKDVTLTALKYGCHVLGEKPLAETLDDARAMIEAAQHAGKLLAVIQNRRYDANIRRLRTFLDQRMLGPLTTVNSDFYTGAHFGGFRDVMRHVLLLDMAIHTFDAARFLTRSDPVAVYCHEWNPAGSWYAHGASAVAIFEMTDGLVYTYRGSWCAEGLPTTWESDWRIIGRQGSARWDGGTQMNAQVVTATGGFHSTVADVAIPEYQDEAKSHGHASNIREFINCVRAGAIPETSATDNIKSLAMVLGAIESAETGKRVEILL
jgi:predicted dehydrogenase